MLAWVGSEGPKIAITQPLATTASPPFAKARPVEPSGETPVLRWQVITDLTQLEALVPAWHSMRAASGHPEPMQSPEWLLNWWRVYAPGSDRGLRVGTCWLGSTLVALAPLCRRTYLHRGLLPFRRLELLGSDVDENDGVCSEYLGIPGLPEWEERVVESLIRHITRGDFGAWDEVVFAGLDGSRVQTRCLAEAFERRDYRVERAEMTTAPYICLPPSWDAFLKQLSKSKRWNLKTQLRDFDAWADGQATWHEARTRSELEEGKRALKELHAERWSGAGAAGAFASERFGRFHDAYMAALLEAGKLELIWVKVGGRPVAALYAFREAGKVCFYQSGRVLDVPQKVRLGSVIVARAIQRAIERGDREFDLLGGPARYKLAFTQTTRLLVSLRVGRPSVVEAVRSLGERVVGMLRWLRRGKGPKKVEWEGE